jgi:hypothetical protein
MEYRFNFTRRLLLVGLLSCLALLVLLFSLGFQLGMRMADEPVAPAAREPAMPAPAPAPITTS